MDQSAEKRHTPAIVTPTDWLKPLTYEEWQALPEPLVKWLVRGLLPVEALTMISGPRKRAYKTYVAMLVAALLVSGKPYNRFPSWVAEEPKNVLFLEQEGTQHDNRRRFRNLLTGMNVDPNTPNFQAKFWWAFRSMFKLDNPKMVQDLIGFMLVHDVKLVILDAMTFMHRGEPNSERDMGVVAQSLIEIRARTGAAVMWLSHTNKESDSADHDVDRDIRGSSILADIYDTHIAIRRKKKRILTTTCRFRDTKEKEFELFWNLPDPGPNDEPPVGPAWVDVLTVVRESGEKASLNPTDQMLAAGWVPGQVYDIGTFAIVFGVKTAAAMELRTKLLQEGKLATGPTGSGCMLPLRT